MAICLNNIANSLKSTYRQMQQVRCTWKHICYLICYAMVLFSLGAINTDYIERVNTVSHFLDEVQVFYNNRIVNKTVGDIDMRRVSNFQNSLVEDFGGKMQGRLRNDFLQLDWQKIGRDSANFTQFQFGVELMRNIGTDNQTLDALEYIRINATENLDMAVKQSRICVVSPFRNLLQNSSTTPPSFSTFLQSLNSQNYSNYHLYLINDASTDTSLQATKTLIFNYPYLYHKTTIITNKEPIGKLGCLDTTIRRFCMAGDIVVEVGVNGGFIGKQVLNFVNRVYRGNGGNWNNGKDGVWFMYGDYVEVVDGEVREGGNQALTEDEFRVNNYRADVRKWVTGPLRTFLFDLYVTIPVVYFLEEKTGSYYTQAHDKYIVFALVQLAGYSHTKFLPKYLYFSQKKAQAFPCHNLLSQYHDAQSRLLKPFKPLNSLDSPIKPRRMYEIPNKLLPYYFLKQMKVFDCIKSNNDRYHAWP